MEKIQTHKYRSWNGLMYDTEDGAKRADDASLRLKKYMATYEIVCGGSRVHYLLTVDDSIEELAEALRINLDLIRAVHASKTPQEIDALIEGIPDAL